MNQSAAALRERLKENHWARARAFAQVLAVQAKSFPDPEERYATAVRTFGEHSHAAYIFRAALPGMESESIPVTLADARVSFFELVQEGLLISRIPEVRRVAFYQKLLGFQSGAAAAWVGRGKAIPATAPTLVAASLAATKVAGIIVASSDALTHPKSQDMLLRDLVRACQDVLNAALMDPNNAGSAEEPASILHGESGFATTNDPRGDLNVLLESFDGDLGSAVLITTPALGAQLALYGAASGGTAFIDSGARGGAAAGLPLYTCRAVPGTTSGSVLALVDADALAAAFEELDLSVATDARIELSTAPTGNTLPAAATSYPISLFQDDASAFRVIARANWRSMRPNSVAYIQDANYSAP